MIYRIGRMKRMMAAAMLASVLLSGCGSAPVDPSASSAPPAEEETAQESEAQELEKQLIAILNLGNELGEPVESDSSLDQVADFCLACVLQNPQSYWDKEQPAELDGMPELKDTVVFVYDGTMPATQAGTAFLTDVKKVNRDPNSELQFHRLKNLAVVYGEGETGSVWLILAYYKSGLQGGGEENLTTEDTDKDQENQEDQEEQEDLGNTDPTA